MKPLAENKAVSSNDRIKLNEIKLPGYFIPSSVLLHEVKEGFHIQMENIF